METNMTGNSLLPTKASLIKHKRTTLERIEKYISDEYFTETNLRGKLYPEVQEIQGIETFPLEKSWEEWKVEDILEQEFQPTEIGATFGPPWSTHWFKLNINIPDEWVGKYVCLRWISQSEAMIYDENGTCLQGLTTGTDFQLRTDYCISESYQVNQSPLTLFIEMACSKMFGVGKGGMINPPDKNATFTLTKAEIAVMDRTVYSLLMDFQCLHDIAKELDDNRGYVALYIANEMINEIIDGNVEAAQKMAEEYFRQGGGQIRNTLALIGNCHIDSAWLWPFSETKRKCARSWLSSVRLMDTYEDSIFVISQAQQLDWVKIHYPDIYETIKGKVKDGRVVPVGSTWVEMDGLLPSGESFMRQFLYGQKFYHNEFGQYCKEFWLPDTFGYSGQIPQICQQFDLSRFLTQKLSWSLVNKFPHHTFIWEGIDGSQILAHFPPGDSYEMSVKPKEMLKSEINLMDKGRTNVSGFLYGHGDGGGGVTAEMLERAQRLADVDGLPKLKHMTPDDLFQILESEKENLCKWVGELYLELHNGTYTSQAKTKLFNRQCEFSARDTEILMALAAMKRNIPKKRLEEMRDLCEIAWKKVLLNQFHDVIPGSSIGMVYDDSDKLYEEALKTFDDIKLEILETFEAGVTSLSSIMNTLPWETSTVISTVDGYSEVKSKPMSFGIVVPWSGEVNVQATGNGRFIISNPYLTAEISPTGQILFLDGIFNTTKTGNILTIYDDVPLYWDAWDVMDYHLETRKILNNDDDSFIGTHVSLKLSDPHIVQLEYSVDINEKSSLHQVIELKATDRYLTFNNTVTWHESHKFLKIEFDTELLSREALYDIQFGHLARPTHRNTSWDTARFEVCSHKWMSLSQYGRGLAVLNDCKYGASAIDGKFSLSLLRSPKAPDDFCDMGEHHFKYGVMPHSGDIHASRVVQAAYEFNVRPTLTKITYDESWFEITNSDQIILEAMKISEKSTSAVIFRLYECQGGLAKASINLPSVYKSKNAYECNGLEEQRTVIEISKNSDTDVVPLIFKPFEIKTIKVEFEDTSSGWVPWPFKK